MQAATRESVSKFMAYVHKSVNEVSQQFLTNERRYNYTTPKSFLEQITLYQNLLKKKNLELQAKIVRLENGLEKLRSTASQVCFQTFMFHKSIYSRKALHSQVTRFSYALPFTSHSVLICLSFHRSLTSCYKLLFLVHSPHI